MATENNMDNQAMRILAGMAQLIDRLVVSPMYTLADVAKLLQMSEYYVRVAVKKGDLRGVKLGDTWRFRAADVNAYIAMHDSDFGTLRLARAVEAENSVFGTKDFGTLRQNETNTEKNDDENASYCVLQKSQKKKKKASKKNKEKEEEEESTRMGACECAHTHTGRFRPKYRYPKTVDDVIRAANEAKNGITMDEAKEFLAMNIVNDWHTAGGVPMYNWRAALANFIKKCREKQATQPTKTSGQGCFGREKQYGTVI